MLSLDFIARKTKIVTNEFSGEQRSVCEKSRKLKYRNKVHKFTSSHTLISAKLVNRLNLFGRDLNLIESGIKQHNDCCQNENSSN